MHHTRSNIHPAPASLAGRLAAVLLVASASSGLWAQTAAPSEPRNVVSLTARASMEVPQDTLTMRLSSVIEGTDPNTVQGQVRQALEAALAEVKKVQQPGAMEVRTGNISLQPRYGGRDNKITGWTGSAELLLEGSDFARIATASGKVQTMVVGGAYFSLSRDARQKAEAEMQAAAIERFKARASTVAKSFGLSGYTIREVNVSGDDGYNPGGVMLMSRAEASPKSFSSVSAPIIPVESGKTHVAVSVSGSVQLK